MEFTRVCPLCKGVISHKSKNARNTADAAGRSCKPCSKRGSNNPFFGKSFSPEQIEKWQEERTGTGNSMHGKKSAFAGRHHSDHAIRTLQEIKREWWKEKGANPTEFQRYRTEVERLTERQPLHLLENFDKRGRAGNDGAYHLDHKISVWYGFRNGIPAEDIANISNLQMLPWLENQRKWID